MGLTFKEICHIAFIVTLYLMLHNAQWMFCCLLGLYIMISLSCGSTIIFTQCLSCVTEINSCTLVEYLSCATTYVSPLVELHIVLT